MIKLKSIIILISALSLSQCFSSDIQDHEESKIIYLCKEAHGEKDDVEFQQNILKLASKRRVIYAKEALERNGLLEDEQKKLMESQGVEGLSNGYLYGIEDSHAILFTSTLIINNALRVFDGIGEDPKSTFSHRKHSMLVPLFHESNQEFLESFWKSQKLKKNPIFKYLKMNRASLIEKTLASRIAAFDLQLAKWKASDWIELTHELGLSIGEKLNEKLTEEKRQSLEFVLTCLDEFETNSDCDMSAQSGVFMNILSINLRNHFIIKNLENIYDITRGLKKPVVCIIGYNHVEEVKKGLEDQGFTILGREELLKSFQQEWLNDEL